MHGFEPRLMSFGKVPKKVGTFMQVALRMVAGKPKLGPNLVTNGGPNIVATTGWTASTSTLSAANGRLVVLGTGAGAGRADQQVTCVPNCFYELGFDTQGTSTGKSARIGTSAGGTQIVSTGAVATGSYKRRFRATQATMHLALVDGDATGSNQAEFTNVYIKKINF